MKCPNCNSESLISLDIILTCSDCGFTTNPYNTDLSVDYQLNPVSYFDKVLINTPKVIQDTVKYSEETETYWIYDSHNEFPRYAYSPILVEDKVKYIFVKYNPIHILNRINFPDPNNKGKYLEYELDYDTAIEVDSYSELTKLF